MVFQIYSTQLSNTFFYIILLLKQQPHQNILYNAAKFLVPQMKHPSVIDNSEWSITEEDIKHTRQSRDANDLQAMLFAISRGNPNFATRAISNMLSNDASKIK